MSSAIEWTEETWNPVVGCSFASEGCRNCYAVGMTHRLGSMALADIDKGKDPGKKGDYVALTVKNSRGVRHFNGQVRTIDSALSVPLRRKTPTRYFVNSMADLFHPKVPFDFIDKVFAVMALCPQHTFQVLTKRPERMAEYTNELYSGQRSIGDASDGMWSSMMASRLQVAAAFGVKPGGGVGIRTDHPLKNVWLGTSVEDQATADERIPHLLRCPAAVRWLSCEPLLGAVDITCGLPHYKCDAGEMDAIYHGERCKTDDCGWRGLEHPDKQRRIETTTPGGIESGLCRCLQAGVDRIYGGVDWVVAGGESGKGARPMHPDWARSLRDQCQAAGVPFFFKQWGHWVPYEQSAQAPMLIGQDGREVDGHAIPPDCVDQVNQEVGGWMMDDQCDVYRRVYKKAAGRLLDGVEHNEYPAAEAASAVGDKG
jgi:protein gp37